jgi:hypothetical protein
MFNPDALGAEESPLILSVARPLHPCRFDGWHDAGWVARRRPLAEPLSPRGSQPAHRTLRRHFVAPNESAVLAARVPALQYKSFAPAGECRKAETASAVFPNERVGLRCTSASDPVPTQNSV